MPTTARIAGPLLGAETGRPDDDWISAVRTKLGDNPKWKNETQTGNGTTGGVAVGSMPWQVSAPKVNDGSFAVTVGGASVPFDSPSVYPPAAGKVWLNYDTGEIFFGTVPASSAALSWNYQTCRWRDQDILDALSAGLRAMWPRVGRAYYDETIQLSVTQWDYDLPAAAQVPGAKLISLAFRSPNISTDPWTPYIRYKRIGNERIRIFGAETLFPGTIQMVYWGPHQRLGDMAPELFWLPVWYALSSLLPWKESERIRDDRAVAQTAEGGQQPGLLTQTGDYYYNRWKEALASYEVGQPAVEQPFVSTYDLRNGAGVRG